MFDEFNTLLIEKIGTVPQLMLFNIDILDQFVHILEFHSNREDIF
jgi:hypothetical protein